MYQPCLKSHSRPTYPMGLDDTGHLVDLRAFEWIFLKIKLTPCIKEISP